MALCPPLFHTVSTFTCTYCIFHHQSHKRVFLVLRVKGNALYRNMGFQCLLNGQQRGEMDGTRETVNLQLIESPLKKI